MKETYPQNGGQPINTPFIVRVCQIFFFLIRGVIWCNRRNSVITSLYYNCCFRKRKIELGRLYIKGLYC